MKSQLPDHMISRLNTEKIDELFGGTDMLMVLVRTDDVLKAETLKRVNKMSKEMNRIKGVEPAKAVKETAAEALRLVEDLERSDEKATVQDAAGRALERWELQELAAGERR